jgi:hypothetical protein
MPSYTSMQPPEVASREPQKTASRMMKGKNNMPS